MRVSIIRRVDEKISSNLGLQTTIDFCRALEETERRIPDESNPRHSSGQGSLIQGNQRG